MTSEAEKAYAREYYKKHKEEKNVYQREHRKQNGNVYTHRYEKTIPGFLMRSYRNMQSRVSGVQKKKAHLYKGLSLLDRQDFYDLSKNDWHFFELWLDWIKSDYDRKLTPSVNRIDSSRGYEPDNIEWLTHSENSRLGAMSGRPHL
jgi:hypothetical protein